MEEFRFLTNRKSLDMKRCETLYSQDPDFHRLVKALESIITELQLSPAEVRQAAMYACYKAEMMRVTPLFSQTIADFEKE